MAADTDALLSLSEVQRMVGLHKATIYRKISAGKFPSGLPLRVNVLGRAKAVAWRKSDILSYLEQAQ
jgi:predicted DNA-binding transcriptional regulator AlpA